MSLKWLKDNTIYVTLAGSQAYGLANELSDVDVKGICIPPRSVEYGLFDKVEQVENDKELEDRLGHLKNPKNPKFESTIYTLRKFFLLAANVNPNIVELLFTDPRDHYVCMPVMEAVLEKRDWFLSSKAKFTFSGYAFAQAAKIERHRKWIVMGELTPPDRAKFGLPPVKSPGVEEVFGYIKSRVEQWNLNQYPMDEMVRADLKETIWELVYSLANKHVNWDNWPDAYAEGVIEVMRENISLKDDVVKLINAERNYFKAKNTYDSWVRWKNERNPARRELEVKSGYDTKHASHLVRLMRMGYEILTEGKVIVRRPDADELLSIKNGGWTYERVMEYQKEMQIKLDEAYANLKVITTSGKVPIIPHDVNRDRINEFYHSLVDSYWNKL
jgi:predicted nucleotidyltransferase